MNRTIERAVYGLVREQMDEPSQEINKAKENFLSTAKATISKKAGTIELRKKQSRCGKIASCWLDKEARLRKQAEALERTYYDQIYDEMKKHDAWLKQVGEAGCDLEENLFLILSFGTKEQLDKLQEIVNTAVAKLRDEEKGERL